MPGWHIHMNVARKALAQLTTNPTAGTIASADGFDAAALTAIARANPTYVALGAIGPDIFFMLPDFKPVGGSNMMWKLASFVREFYMAWDDNFLGPYESAMGPIANNAADELNALTGGLKDSLEGIFGQASALLQDTVVKLIVNQFDFFGLLSSGVPAGYDEWTFYWSDMLHYRATYRFGVELWKSANAEVDADTRARFQAFALGWITHLATDVAGHPFVNQKVGGPYRLHWQRHHLVENHMDSLVYTTEHGTQPIYDQMANSALHLWLAFNPDGSSRVNLFVPEPNTDTNPNFINHTYPTGDDSASVTARHAAWDVDSDMPEDLAQLIASTIEAVYSPKAVSPLDSLPNGQMKCCPTIIATLDGRVPLETQGLPNKGDIIGAYWWLYRYIKHVTTDYYKIRRPVAPSVLVIPAFPSPPGSGDSDPGPGAGTDGGFWKDALDALLALLAWLEYCAQVVAYLPAVLNGIIAGTATYPLREALYEFVEVPLYNAWLAVHTYMAMTGYVMPMPGETNKGLNTLGVSVDDGWAVTVAALADVDGGLTPATLATDPSGSPDAGYPKGVLADPPNFLTGLFTSFSPTATTPIDGEVPSEFMRPWRWPGEDNEGDTVNIEGRFTVPGPFTAGMDANSLLGGMPGTKTARDELEATGKEEDTISKAIELFARGEQMGDPQDYAAYLVAKLTRDTLDSARVANLNLDSDRGYAYQCWDWVRNGDWTSKASAFMNLIDPSQGVPTDQSEHLYDTPVAPGWGWNPSEKQTGLANPFLPKRADATVEIRYIDKQKRPT